MREIKKNSFFLVIPTREREEHLLNLLEDLREFSEYISQCVIVDQSEVFLGNGFDFENYPYKITILKGNVGKGVNNSRNLALKEYNDEDWIFCLDDDLRAEADELKKIPEFLKQSSVNCLVLGCEKSWSKQSIKVYDDLIDTISKPNNLNEARMRLQVSSGACIVDREYFVKAGFYFDEVYDFWGDDLDLGFRLLFSGALIYYYPEIKITHLEVKTGGQRSYKENLNIKKKRIFLKLYFYKKFFSIKAFKERVFLDIILSLKSLKFKDAIYVYQCYLKLNKLPHAYHNLSF